MVLEKQDSFDWFLGHFLPEKRFIYEPTAPSGRSASRLGVFILPPGIFVHRRITPSINPFLLSNFHQKMSLLTVISVVWLSWC